MTDYVSIGDYVLDRRRTSGDGHGGCDFPYGAGGADTMMNPDSTESFEGDLLEYPQYSRPEEWMEKKFLRYCCPDNHKLVDEWRREQSIIRTQRTPSGSACA